MSFLRTGLLGCVIEGKIFVLGLYEDRIRQKVEWVEPGVQEPEHRYFFVQHLVSSIMKHIPKIHDWYVLPQLTKSLCYANDPTALLLMCMSMENIYPSS